MWNCVIHKFILMFLKHKKKCDVLKTQISYNDIVKYVDM